MKKLDILGDNAVSVCCFSTVNVYLCPCLCQVTTCGRVVCVHRTLNHSTYIIASLITWTNVCDPLLTDPFQ